MAGKFPPVTHFALFRTAIGHCAVAWGDNGLIGVQLPEASVRETRARMQSRFRGVSEVLPTRDVSLAMDQIVKLLDGQATDLSSLVLDMTHLPPFHRRVYAVARKIPAGRTLSYGDVAVQLGSPNAARAVGQAMGRNPFPIIVPCHRVLAAGGKIGGFTAPGGTRTKQKMLAIEARAIRPESRVSA